MPADPFSALFEKTIGRDPVKRFYLTWVGIWAGIAILVTALLYPIRQSINEVDREFLSYRAQDELIRSIGAFGPQSEQKYKEYLDILEKEIKGYLSPKAKPSVTAKVSSLARKQKVTIKKINFLEESAIEGQDSYRKLPLYIEVEGEYRQVGQFLVSVEDEMPYYFVWDKVVIGQSDAGTGTVRVNLLMAFFAKK